MTQDEVLKILKTGANVFLTGEPGSGKTHTINKYIAFLRACGIEPAITASTGIAATHIGGFTIHSWSGIGIKNNLTAQDLDRMSQNERLVRRAQKAKVLIIDEVSMLASPTLSLVDRAIRALRNSDTVFGGLQVILVGDFFQLPPITRRQPAMLAIEDATEPVFAYHSPLWGMLNPMVCYLSEQHRQSDERFLKILSAMRQGKVENEHRRMLFNRRIAPAFQGSSLPGQKVNPKITKLFSHNIDVDRVNHTELDDLSGERRAYEMEIRGAPAVVEQMKRTCLSPEVLVLKIGARVMFTKNSAERGYFNGTLGEVVNFRHEDGLPVVKTKDGKIIVAEPTDWVVEAEGREIAAVTQIPLRLAWAITVHKSQGMSLDEAEVDLSSAFEYGQGYVALSRVRSLSGLYLLGLNKRALEVHPDILARDRLFRETSVEVNKAFGEMNDKEIAQMHDNFIQSCGGRMPSDVGSEGLVSSSKRALKMSTFDVTAQMLEKEKDLNNIAKERNLKLETIITHLERLARDGKIDPRRDLAYLIKGQGEAITKIHQSFDKFGSDKLSVVFNHFGGKMPYEKLKLARVFYEPGAL